MKFITDNVEWTDAMKVSAATSLEKKLGKTGIDFSEAEIKLSKIKDYEFKVEVNIANFRAHAIDKDFYNGMNKVSVKIKSLILKHKKLYKHNKIREQILTEPSSVLAKDKEFILEPISLDDAIINLNYTDYSFYTYWDLDEDCVCILYTRYDGTIGRIKCK